MDDAERIDRIRRFETLTRTPAGHRTRSRPPDLARERISDDRRRPRALVATGRLVPRARAA